MTIRDRVGNTPENLGVKAPCSCATTANITLAGLQTIDGVTLVENQRVLVWKQSDSTQNGIYQASTGNWTRPHDANNVESFVQGTATIVSGGSTYANRMFSVTTSADPIVIGTTALTFVVDGVTGPPGASGAPGAAGAPGATGVAAGGVVLGRLTLQSGTPVMTTTQSGKTTIYFTAGQAPIYDGSNMVATAFAELSVATSDTTKSPAAIGASKVNDWFIWNDSGTIRLGHGPDWTNDTTRSAGTALTLVNGVYLNNASITNGPAASRGTYVGTTRSNGSSQLDWIFGAVAASWTAGFFGVWNVYNRVEVESFSGDTTDSWTYATATTWRAANGNATARYTFVRGLDEDSLSAEYKSTGAAGAGTYMVAGVGLDTTTSYTGTTGFQNSTNAVPIAPRYAGFPGIGVHYVSANEYNSTTTASTWYGDAGAPTAVQTGLHIRGKF